MVDRKIPGFFAAVLAPELVAPEDLLLGKFNAGAGPFDNLV